MVDYWAEIMGAISRNWGKLLGAVLGLIVGIIIVSFGFWKAIFLVICLALGYFVGSRLDGGGPGGWD
jgi:uncharacterized membrane protein